MKKLLFRNVVRLIVASIVVFFLAVPAFAQRDALPSKSTLEFHSESSFNLRNQETVDSVLLVDG